MTELHSFLESREQIWERLREKARLAVPEWKFHPEDPDIGTALAILFTDMMSDSVSLFQQRIRQYPVCLYHLLDADIFPASGASGQVTFSTVNDEVEGSYLERGTEVIGEGDEGEPIPFETEEDLFVSPAVLQKIFYVDGTTDYISQPLSLPLWDNRMENRQTHEFYIGHDYLFSVLTRGQIRLHFSLQSVQQAQELEERLLHDISWFYSCDEGFHPFFSVHFENGTLILDKEMGTAEQPFPKMAKREQNGRNCFWLRAECRLIAPDTQIVFPAISLSSSGSHLIPDMVYNGERELEADHFLPFGESPVPFAEFCIGSEEVFSKKGAEITIHFQLSFQKIPSEFVSPEIPIQWKAIMHSSDFKEKKKHEITIVTVLWEYYNGNGWAMIPETRQYEMMFGSGEPGTYHHLVFSCPEDTSPVLVGAWETFCIRARIVKMSHTITIDGVYLVPVMDDLTLSYRYTGRRGNPETAYAVNEMTEEPMNCTDEFLPFYNSFPRKKMLYLAFSRPLREELIRLLITLRQPQERPNALCRYEYYGGRGFMPWRVEDETESLSRTGSLVTEACHDFEKQTFFGISGYWLRLTAEDGEVSSFQEIKDLVLNSVRATAKSESGSRGNLEAGKINRTAENIGFINQVINREAFAGGCDREEPEHAGRREASWLRHRNRAVTKRDFEDIVYGGVRSILQVKCFPGRDEKGNRAAGHITLAVLTEGEVQFSEKKKEILECLRPCMSRLLLEEHRLHIIRPQRVAVKGHLSVVIPEEEKQYRVREKLKQRICDFIHPVTGNFDGKGWEIGVLPTAMQIQNACSQVKGVSYIRHISLEWEQDRGLYALGASGNHEIEIYKRGV